MHNVFITKWENNYVVATDLVNVIRLSTQNYIQPQQLVGANVVCSHACVCVRLSVCLSV